MAQGASNVDHSRLVQVQTPSIVPDNPLQRFCPISGIKCVVGSLTRVVFGCLLKAGHVLRKPPAVVINIHLGSPALPTFSQFLCSRAHLVHGQPPWHFSLSFRQVSQLNASQYKIQDKGRGCHKRSRYPFSTFFGDTGSFATTCHNITMGSNLNKMELYHCLL